MEGERTTVVELEFPAAVMKGKLDLRTGLRKQIAVNQIRTTLEQN